MTMSGCSDLRIVSGKTQLARLRPDRRLTSAATSGLRLALTHAHPDFPFPAILLSSIMETTLRRFVKGKKPTVGFLV